jgi:8-oxo-dGTP pyrophosphatase MutT (NUDIX family)
VTGTAPGADGGAAEVHAGGGAVWRERDGALEVLLVHRPRYADWTLPKGKLDVGENHLQAALREVHEETALVCAPGPELATTRYVDSLGRSKLVRYWAMTVERDDGFAPNDEVDELRWVALPAAAEMLSYRRDVEVLRSLPGALATS